MKTGKMNLFGKVAFLLMFTGLFAGCGDDNDKLPPGSYVEREVIQTFPGDTVLVSGTASNYDGLAAITLSSENWDIYKLYDLAGQKPTVFNYDYQLAVPETATFEEKLLVSVEDVNEAKTNRTIILEYVADMQSPVLQSSFPDQVSADFDAVAGKGVWTLDVKFSDDRKLKDVRLEVPALAIDETVEQTGRMGELRRELEFPDLGSFPVLLTIRDAADNETIALTTVVVMMSEDEDPYQDFTQMYLVNAGENETDYVNGYYRYMDRTGDYQYMANFYAPEDNTPVYFVPAKTMEGDLFGMSPQVSSKLLNKNGYVKPIILPTKGYYTVWIDLDAHSYSVTEYTVPADTYTGALMASGTGFTMGDWAVSGEMTLIDAQNPYRKEVELELATGYVGDLQYYFTSPDWTRIFRSDVDGKWWFESESGACIIYTTDYAGNVTVTFDTAALWAIIRKN